jgi:hypothetical protein
MNYKEYKVTSIFLMLEAAKYERAANYILQEVIREDLYNIQPSKMNYIRNGLIIELKKKYESIRREYPDKITIEQMRDIAGKVYQDTYQSLPIHKN